MYPLLPPRNNREVWLADVGETIQRTQYYPSGLPWKSNTGDVPEEQNKKYNGKEFVEAHGLDEYDSEARWYYPAIMRTTTLDPLAEKYYSISPYAWCGNNPVRMIDPDGKEWKDNNGNVIEDENLKNVQVYIFYSDDFSGQAMKQYDEAVEKYGAGSVALSNTGSTEGFSTDWGNMQGDVNSVMIMTHGKNQSIAVGKEGKDQITATGDGATNIKGTEVPNVQDLPQPKANLSNATLYMYSCHSADNEPKAHGQGDHAQGELKGSKKPIAQVFSEIFNFQNVQGTKGSVNYTNPYIPLAWAPMTRNPYGSKPYPENGRWVLYYKKRK
ncbi:hypothetical protein TRIP_D300213 [uncultured Paludibacter sp.]|uniref:RHS repeat-associated core domain-containing protein n=1 Tax=uncultured Paludibacter sp. TaxID=497635 RepID=A0A653ABN5_9BACT|nr:hypothetical protein TRIP_D300213 [uncultured Paludibacter sp.]